MANYKTAAQRYNDRMDKIWARARQTEPEWGAQDKEDAMTTTMLKRAHIKAQGQKLTSQLLDY